MISPKRVATIFETKGGNGTFTKTFDALSESEKGRVMGLVNGDEPLIAGFLSSEEWFVVTHSSLILSQTGQRKSISLGKITRLKSPTGAADLATGKQTNGRFELELQDGSAVSFEVEGGKPFVGLLNVFMYVVKMNRRPG